MRLSLAQLVFLPDLGAHSALFLAVEAIKRDNKARHLSGLMNAVLRRAAAFEGWTDLPVQPLPGWLRRRLKSVYGASWSVPSWALGFGFPPFLQGLSPRHGSVFRFLRPPYLLF